ncbi:DnaJ-domain-containing protein [Apiospora phragmitis]|uniref:DnaJ-domain-containing protein n=1 Tax=Apiospora phragmitis TaxID=2905665 RepID=A0ABR1X7G5_9PEZI
MSQEFGARPSISDCYRTLGLVPGADEAEIRAAFRKLSFKLHPDRAGQSQATNDKFAALRQAYEDVLDWVAEPKQGRWAEPPPGGFAPGEGRGGYDFSAGDPSRGYGGYGGGFPPGGGSSSRYGGSSYGGDDNNDSADAPPSRNDPLAVVQWSLRRAHNRLAPLPGKLANMRRWWDVVGASGDLAPKQRALGSQRFDRAEVHLVKMLSRAMGLMEKVSKHQQQQQESDEDEDDDKKKDKKKKTKWYNMMGSSSKKQDKKKKKQGAPMKKQVDKWGVAAMQLGRDSEAVLDEVIALEMCAKQDDLDEFLAALGSIKSGGDSSEKKQHVKDDSSSEDEESSSEDEESSSDDEESSSEESSSSSSSSSSSDTE